MKFSHLFSSGGDRAQGDPKERQALLDPVDLVPSLRQVIEAASMNSASLTVALASDSKDRITVPDRHMVFLVDDKDRHCQWHAPPLHELFRGNKMPPNLTQYPPEYAPVFYYIEQHTLTADTAIGGKLRDRELEEIYGTLRRRPDGRSLGPVHDFLWQVAAVLLASRPTSQAEHQEIFGRLARSCSNFAMDFASRNYIARLRADFGPRSLR